MRIQEYAVGVFMECPTKSSLKKALKKKLVFVNGKVASSATFIYGGEEIGLISDPNMSKAYKKFHLELEVIFEDDYLLAIHKPAGLRVSGNHFKTVKNALPQGYQPVHRLDYPTTGLLLIGKTSESIRVLNKMFEEKKFKKSYYAIAIGNLDKEGDFDQDIDDKGARTHYIKLSSVESDRFGQLSLLQVVPQTGRRHQIRKHLAQNGHPILGDKDYSSEGLLLKGKGLYLHADSLSFIHPFTQEKMTLTDPLPQRFRKIFPLIEST